MINATIIGNLGGDPQTKTVGSSTVTEISVASNHGWGDRQSTTWVRCSFWGKRGERLAEHFAKGDSIVVHGKVHTREVDGKVYVNCDANDWDFPPKARDSRGGQQAGPQQGRDSDPETGGGYGGGSPADADIPFAP